MDQIEPTEFASLVTAITSAFGDPTRRDIFLLITSSTDGMTAAEVAQHFDVHTNVARHHLDKLCAGGYLRSALDRPTGVGRPSKRYSITSEPMAFNVPVRQDDLLVRLLGAVLEDLGPDRSAVVAEDVGIAYGAELATALGPDARRSFRSALHSVADALSSHGFGARTETDGESLKLVTDHCPFGNLPSAHPVLCAMDRGIVTGMMQTLHHETPVNLTSAAQVGRTHCTTVFRSA